MALRWKLPLGIMSLYVLELVLWCLLLRVSGSDDLGKIKPGQAGKAGETLQRELPSARITDSISAGSSNTGSSTAGSPTTGVLPDGAPLRRAGNGTMSGRGHS